MIATRIRLVEFIRVLSEKLIHLILSDFISPGNIHVETQVHSLPGDTRLLYDATIEIGWESRNLDDVTWAVSNLSMSKTTIFLSEEVTCPNK